jgi:hypothetical protein
VFVLEAGFTLAKPKRWSGCGRLPFQAGSIPAERASRRSCCFAFSSTGTPLSLTLGPALKGLFDLMATREQ